METGNVPRLLLIEDSENDAVLLLRVLNQGGYEVTCRRVNTAPAMEAVLKEERWDIVIYDYTRPGFSGTRALALIRKKGIDLPFIIVSGAVGEDAAVEAMRAGAQDFVRKDDLGRLIPAIERELADAEVRRERRRAEMALRESEERFRWLVEQITDYEIYVIDPEGHIIAWNTGAERHTGYRAEEVIGRHHSIFFMKNDIEQRIPEIELEAAAREGRFDCRPFRRLRENKYSEGPVEDSDIQSA